MAAQFRNIYSHKLEANLLRLLRLLVFVFFGFFALKNIYQLYSGSYLIEPDKLIRLDTMQLLNRAYRYSGGKGSSSGIEFESISRNKFLISSSYFFSIADIDKLTDTLMYHGTNFLAYTDKKGYKLFKNNSKSFIEVYQFVIGDKQYIDISKANQLAKDKLVSGIFMWCVLFGILFFIRLKKLEE